jgi:hypothetical protein
MTDTKSSKPGPVEVWLSKPNIEITCTIVREDETTTHLDIDSLSMRGAQREMTGWLIGRGYTPIGRWNAEQTETDGFVEGTVECMRQFKPGADAESI